MSKIVLAISDRWVIDARIGAIAAFALKLNETILALHVAYGSDDSGAETKPGERVLATLAEMLSARGAKVETQFLFADDVAAAIINTAADHEASMIVLGLSTKGMLTRLIEGNVVQEIIRATHIPVLLLPAEWDGAL